MDPCVKRDRTAYNNSMDCENNSIHFSVQQDAMASQLSPQISCPACWEIFISPHVPKILDCLHSCCSVCLGRFAVLESGHQVTCPVVGCGVKTAIVKGVDVLETNIQLQNMAAEVQNSGLSGSGGKPTLIKCLKHDNVMDMYCLSCSSLICQSCASAEHSGHKTKNLDAVTTEQKELLESVLNDTKNEGLVCKQSIQELQTLENSVAESVGAEEKEIDRAIQLWIAEVLKEGHALKSNLQQFGNAKREKIQKEVARFEKRTNKLQSAGRAVKEISAWPNYAYVTQHDSMIQKMKTLSVEGRNWSVNTNPNAAKFIKEIGKPSVHLGKVLKVIAPRKLHLIQEFDSFEDAYKIAVSSNNMIAVCDSYYGKKQVLIYHQQNQGQYVKKMTLTLQPSNVWGPKGIVISQDGCFFVARKIGVEVYSPEGEYLKTIITRSKELSDQEVDVSSVTSLSNGRILAGDIDRCIITEHDSSGKLVWMLRTSIKPYYMTSINDEQVAITDYTSNKVVVMDIKSGREVLQMDIPLVQGICYDAQTESLLIVRNEGSQYQQPISRTGVVEQYCCSTGRLVARLAHGLYYPKGLALTSDGFFVVADQTTVKVYQIM